jgi:hypothetical protein
MSNCFDMKCSKCGGGHRPDIAALVQVRLTHDGTDADVSEDGGHHWDDDSSAACAACGYGGTVRDFNSTPRQHPLPCPRLRAIRPEARHSEQRAAVAVVVHDYARAFRYGEPLRFAIALRGLLGARDPERFIVLQPGEQRRRQMRVVVFMPSSSRS